MTGRTLSAVLALALTVASTAAAQTGNPSGGRVGYRVVTRLTLDVTGRVSADAGGVTDREIWAASLDTVIRRSGYAREVQRAGEGDFLKAAALGGFQLVVLAEVDLDGPADSAAVRYSFIDVLSGRTVGADTINGPLPYEYELGDTFWLPLLSKLEKIVPTERHTFVRIKGEKGTQITGFGQKPLIIPDSGELRIEIFVPGTYPWKAEKWGTLTQTGVFAAMENDAVLRIPTVPVRPWAVETGLYMMQFPDLWLERYFFQNHIFARIGFEQYLFGFFLPDPTNENSTTPQGIISLPMIIPGAAIGFQVGDPANFIKPYTYAGALLRYDLDLRAPDPIAPFELWGMFGFDWRASPRISLFAELGAAYYPHCKGYLLLASKGNRDSGPFAYLYGDDWFLEFPRFRLGTRFFL